MTGHKFST